MQCGLMLRSLRSKRLEASKAPRNDDYSSGNGRDLRVTGSIATKVKTASVTFSSSSPSRARRQASTSIFIELRPRAISRP